MPKFTMKDVYSDIEERRARHRQPKPQDGKRPLVLQRLMDMARLRRTGRLPGGEG